jgi:hypothetical protein
VIYSSILGIVDIIIALYTAKIKRKTDDSKLFRKKIFSREQTYGVNKRSGKAEKRWKSFDSYDLIINGLSIAYFVCTFGCRYTNLY